MAAVSFRALGVMALASAAAAGGSVAAQGASSPEVLNALLVEVRGLRSAMETMATAGPRIELALGRLQLQEQRVNNLVRRHTEVREQIATVERDSQAIGHQIDRLQQELSSPTRSDENERRATQQALADRKDVYAQMNTDLQRLRADESDVAQLVAAEQTRWTELNQRLEELERALKRN